MTPLRFGNKTSPMKTALADYLAEHETCEALAKRLGVAKSTISRWSNGRVPRADDAAKLERATKGKVPASSWERAGRHNSAAARRSGSHHSAA